eukprot:7976273-Pyramimonas_sp.AAC.1
MRDGNTPSSSDVENDGADNGLTGDGHEVMLAEFDETKLVDRLVRDAGFVDCVLDLQQRFHAANISVMQASALSL